MYTSTISTEVLVVGSGLAGSCTAALLARRGHRVTVVDLWATYPRLFRAEKIEPDQIELLRKFGLFDAVAPHTRRIHEIVRAQGGRVRARRSLEQYGISYQDIVNPIRDALPAQVERLSGRVESLVADPARPHALLADGRRIEARLIVVANGGGHDLQNSLGLKRRSYQDELSMVFGFELERTDGQPFTWEAVTYRPDRTDERVGYLTLFRMAHGDSEVMRGNFFTYWSARDSRTRELVRNGDHTLREVLPGLDQVIGDYRIAGRVEPFRIDLYRYEGCERPGIVFLADAYQSVCPTTGMGMSKVLTDVDVLCSDFAPQWLAAPQITPEQVAAFYAHPRKKQVDATALKRALNGHRLGTATTLPARLRRTVRDWRWAHAA